MLTPGSILYFTPFYFSNGMSAKNKYFIVLSRNLDDVLVASLPTSKDHIPSQLTKRHGCIDDQALRFNCYCFMNGKIISECGKFSFERDTFVYGEQVDLVSASLIKKNYPLEGTNYIKCGNLSKLEFKRLRKCLLNSKKVKEKIKKHLSV